ncbi:NirD/YgiW/YdeI family stress tolerance protein [Vibrio lamellibrachiae]|uniref:YgiW/YdeI family stress tolerance OB fold protein n=1 Tax=Vibrio lamellibrachiae TaxID=2910253 RepID=UPI003D1518A0
MKTKLMTLTIATTLTLAAVPSFAKGKGHDETAIQYKGPVAVTTIKQMSSDAKLFSDSDVILEGHLTKQLSKDKFLFADGTGEIMVELEDVTINSMLDHETLVRLFGEYEGGSAPEVEVDHIVIL